MLPVLLLTETKIHVTIYSNMNDLKDISNLILKMNSAEDICGFLSEMLTESELSVLSKRWRILNMLSEGATQREVSKELSVSLCKVTRGAKILKDKASITNKYLIKEKSYGNTKA